MEFQNLIEKRRSVRKYVERNTVTKDEILSMIKAAQEAPSWKNSQTGRYYCIMDEKNVEQFRRECLPEMNAGKCENAVLLVSTFVHNRAGFQKDGTADNEIGNGWGCYDLGLQNENLILKAEELGYGTLIMGDLLVIHDTGAHGFAMGYNYNGKLKSSEILLHEDGSFEMIRRAETPKDYFATFDCFPIYEKLLEDME